MSALNWQEVEWLKTWPMIRIGNNGALEYPQAMWIKYGDTYHILARQGGRIYAIPGCFARSDKTGFDKYPEGQIEDKVEIAELFAGTTSEFDAESRWASFLAYQMKLERRVKEGKQFDFPVFPKWLKENHFIS